MNMTMTSKQFQIMTTILKGNDDGSFLDLDQVIQKLSYKTTKQSLQFSIRALIRKGLVTKQEQEKRRGRSRAIVSPTKNGYIIMTG
jgi:predicted transcriptional regulator